MSAFVLRSIAAITMLLDHIGYCFGIFPLRVIGRLAFPLYVFLLVNGFKHTRNRRNYALRLAGLALLSQIPFQLMRFIRVKTWSDFVADPSLWVENFNVMLTLLVALLVIWLCDLLRNEEKTRCICLLPAICAFFLYYFGFLASDYGAKGVLLASVFWFFDGKKLPTAVGLMAAMYYDTALRFVLSIVKGLAFSLGAWELAQLSILLILPLLWLYNGKSGMPKSCKKPLQTAFYLFYPVHMLALWAIVQILS